MTDDARTHAHHAAASTVRHCDVAIIGGSAAGLAAALQLARQQRSVLVVDDGTPRNAPAEHMHGYLGHEGAPPARLRALGREEVRGYGGEVLTGRVLAVRRADDGLHLDLSGGHRLVARRVLAATGIVDELPDIEGLADRWGREVIHCPFCHGFEVRGQRVVQIVTHPTGLHPTRIMRHLVDELTVVVHDATGVDPSSLEALTDAGIPVVSARVARIAGGVGAPLSVELADGRTLPADAVLTGTRFHARVEMLRELGAGTTPHVTGAGDVLAVDPTGRTAVEGLFAAGNVTDPGMQMLPAAAHGGFVGAQIAFDLAAEDLARRIRASGAEAEWDQRYAAVDKVWSANPNGTLVAEASDLAPGRALEVGAGEGADALWLAERGWDVTATDVSGVALDRIETEAARRGLAVRTLRRDAGELSAYGSETYDLVSLQYGSFRRAPDQRGISNLLDAVVEGGTLLVVSHDLDGFEPVDPAVGTQMFDPAAYVGIAEIAARLSDPSEWRIEVHEVRPRPAGAATTQHVSDRVLRATRIRSVQASVR